MRHKSLISLFLALFIALQPVLLASLALPTPVAAAAAQTDPNSSTNGLDLSVPAGTPDGGTADDTVTNDSGYVPTDLADLSSVLSSKSLVLSPQDVNAVKGFQVDTRITNYLLYLVTPQDQGGAGLDHVKVSSIVKGHNSGGTGKYDTESLAQSEGNNLESQHTQGKAVDVSEVGQLTCQYDISSSGVFGVGGSSQVQWQPPTGVKVAWQTKDGLARNPTPSRSSLIGNAMQMSDAGLTQYLNSTGNIDATIDFSKGVDFNAIGLYLGANVLIKDLGAKNVTSDPLLGSFASAIGANVLKSAIPDLPTGITISGINGDIRIGAGQANLEEQLGLPTGSLDGFGWQSILTNTGKRTIEQELGLPSGYLDTHTLKQLNSTSAAKSSFGYITGKPDLAVNGTAPATDARRSANKVNTTTYVNREDDAMNFLPGTVNKIKANDTQGLVMAGAKVLEDVFKMTADQKAALEKAVNAGAIPSTIDPTTFPVNDAISADAISGLFSTSTNAQQKTLDELKQLGAQLISKAVVKDAPQAVGGLTQTVIDLLINQTGNLSTKDIMTQIGAGQLLDQSGIDPSNATKLVATPSNVSYLGPIAQNINQTLSLTGSSALSISDIGGLFSNDPSAAITKIGGAELDRAMGWNNGSGAQVISGQKTLQTASQEIINNAIATIFNLKSGSIPINSTDPGLSISAALVEQALGLPSGSMEGTTDASAVLQKSGPNAFAGVSSASGLDGAASNLLISPSTLSSFIKGKLSTSSLLAQVLSANAANLSTDKLITYFDGSQSIPGTDQLTSLVTYFTSPSTVTSQQKNAALDAAFQLIGGQVDAQARFALNTFENIITAKNTGQAIQQLIDQGLTLFVKTIAGSVGLTAAAAQQTADQMKTFFNGSAANESLRQQLLQLEQIVNPTKAQQQEIANIRNQIGKYINNTLTKDLSNFIIKATGIPTTYAADANSFLGGDWQYGLEAASFVLWQKQINQYLPADAQLTYNQLHDTLDFTDYLAINDRAVSIIGSQSEFDQLDPAEQSVLYDEARQELMNEAQKNVEYSISDSLLRKNDPSIPAGFTKIMFTGTAADKAQMLQSFGVSSLESLFLDKIKGYQPGMLAAALNGNDSTKANIILSLLAGNTGVSLGPITGPNLATYVSFLTSPADAQANFMTNPKYSSMWTAVSGWVGGVLGTTLPTGTVQSLYLASQNNWNFDKSLTNSSGAVVVPSVNSIGEGLVLGKLTGWADQALHLPAGTAYQIYTATTNVLVASQALAASKALSLVPGGADVTAAAQAKLSQAQAGLAMVAITIALQACNACQQFFGSIDRALGAPPGFTSALVSGAIAMALHLGPAGLYAAAAILIIGLFSSTSVSYLCPLPPQDPFSISAYDNSYDQISYGYPYDPSKDPLPVGSPNLNAPPAYTTNASGQKVKVDPFAAWVNSTKFADGNNQQLWMAWSRYYTGRLLEATLAYGVSQSSDANRPKQVITYRRANVEYFTAINNLLTNAFGSYEPSSTDIGLGYSQDSTKTTDWVHVSFGGLF